jgi:very-short-patch-repair endonuclease
MPGDRDKARRIPPEMTRRSRSLRRGMTDAEKKLWRNLRDRRLVGVKFRRQYVVSGYILDFYCPDAKLAVELDGDQHALPERVVYDKQRDVKLCSMGIKVLRFANTDVLKNILGVLEKIREVLENEGH